MKNNPSFREQLTSLGNFLFWRDVPIIRYKPDNEDPDTTHYFTPFFTISNSRVPEILIDYSNGSDRFDATQPAFDAEHPESMTTAIRAAEAFAEISVVKKLIIRDGDLIKVGTTDAINNGFMSDLIVTGGNLVDHAPALRQITREAIWSFSTPKIIPLFEQPNLN